jgi:chemosensory pili system protein ChpA (sensor histidine kinase/response regulator)
MTRCAALMRGVVQLPDYLERLQGGHRDIPIVLLPLLNDLRTARGVDALQQDALPSLLVEATDAEVEHARGSLAGRNRALLDTVSAALKEDLLRVKDALDLHLRAGGGNVADLQPQAEALDRIGETLGMLGLESARGVIHEQRKVVQGIADGSRPPSEDDLMEVAGALIYIEHSLDDQVTRLGTGDAPGDGDDQLAQESRKVMGVLAREAAANFAEVRNAFVAFVETDWDHAVLEPVPRLLAEVAGAMRILNLPQPAGYLEALRRYSHAELLGRKQVPGGRQLDTLADALAGMEYYLESLRDPHGQRQDLLDKTRTSLEQLRYWPLPDDDVATLSESEAVEAAPVAGEAVVFEAPQAVEAADAAAATVSVQADAPVLNAGFDAVGDEIDDEIREIFLEEFQEEITNLDELLAPWKRTPENGELLRPIRRVFHTLKGSGRLVGAKTLGEFSWHVENMLNRVLDGSRPASPAVVAFVGQTRAALPQLLAALRGEASGALDIASMEAVADRLAAGEDVVLDTLGTAPVAKVAEPAVDTAPAVAADTVVAHVDPVLLEILGSEVGGHLETVDAWLAQARAGDASVNDGLLRAIHTLNGAFAMTEVPSVTAFTAPAEGYVKRLLAANAPADADGIAILGEVADAVRTTTAALQSTPAQVPVYAALAARVASLRETLPEVSLPFIDANAEAARKAAEEAEAAEAERIAAEHAEAERLAAEEAARLEAERVENERLEAERLAAEEAEAARLAAEQAEAERIAAEEAAARAEAERLEAERLEAERIAALEAEAARIAAIESEAERLAAQEAARLEAERVEAERLAAQEAARIEEERLEAERIAAAEAEEARLAAERAEAERLAAEEAARLEAERVEAERIAAEEAEAARVAAEQAEAARIAEEEAARAEAERVAAEEAARLEAERVEAERIAAEQAEAARLEAERAEADRQEAERIVAARQEADRQEAARLAEARAEAARVEAERRAAEIAAAAKAREQAALAALLSAATSAEDPDEALDMDGLDAELVDIFVEEGGDLLDHSDGLLALLRDAPEDREAMVGLQRDLHTLKGGARMAGIMPVGELGHSMETLLEAVVAQRAELGRDGVPLLERGFDRLHGMITRVAARRAVGLPVGLIDELNARAETPVAPITEAADDGLVFVPAPAPKIELKPLSAPMLQDGFGDDDDIGIRAPQEQVRIRADLLDRLVNYAGEVAIYRSRLEQQLGRSAAPRRKWSRPTSVCATSCAASTRKPKRRSSPATSASRTGNETFDPLELDRFSTLQQLSRALANRGRLAGLHGSMDDLTRQYETLLLQQSRVSSDLQEGLMRTRMVPFDGLVPRLRRVIRQAAGETGKQAQLKLDGAQGELDRNVLERMTAPLEHMLRNAIAHGLETPEARRKAGKGDEGTIRVAVRREGSEVVLQVGDDGAGLDRAAIRTRAIERGLIKPDAILSDGDLDVLILEPGFSTAETVSRLAGRGVGMDVVASEVRQLGGSLDIASKPGEGTTFTLRLPQTLAVTQAVFVKIGDTQYAVPIASVRGVGRISRDEINKPDAVYRYGGEDYALHDLGSLVGSTTVKAEGQLQIPLLLVRSGDLRAAVAIDQVVGNREIVVKPVRTAAGIGAGHLRRHHHG